MTDRFWSVLLLGVVLGGLAVGWAMQYVVYATYRAQAEAWAVKVSMQAAVADEALRLALPNSVERGLAWAQAVKNVRTAPDPSIQDARGAPKGEKKK